MDQVAEVIDQYVVLSLIKEQSRPGPRKKISKELRSLSAAASAYVRALNKLGDDGLERLLEAGNSLIPQPGASFDPTSVPPLNYAWEDPFDGLADDDRRSEKIISYRNSPNLGGGPAFSDQIQSSARTASLVASASSLLAEEAVTETRPRGTPPNIAAYVATGLLADIWEEFTRLPLSPDGPNREGKFSRFVRNVIRCVEPEFGGHYHAGKIAERRRKIGDK